MQNIYNVFISKKNYTILSETRRTTKIPTVKKACILSISTFFNSKVFIFTYKVIL